MATSRPALIYSPDLALYQTSEISLQGNDLIHLVGDQRLVDPVYTVEKLKYPFEVPLRVSNPEQPARLVSCYEALAAFELAGELPGQLRPYSPRPAGLEELAAVHSGGYLARVQALSAAGGELGESTFVGSGAFKWAALSAGSGLAAAELIRRGEAEAALVLTRPPGHHAGPDRAGGFCIFNNAAILAEFCRRKCNWPRILLVDWDLHHGDGTQEIFYADPGVLFCSLHQFGPELYPEKGEMSETGTGPGAGYTVNMPLPAKTGDADYLTLFRRVVPALAEAFRPDIILVSAGFDAHFNDTQNLYVWDPEGGLSLTAQAYHALTLVVKECAARYCQGRYIILLEGGYNLYSLPAGVVNTAAAMLELEPLVLERLPRHVPVRPLDTAAFLERLSRAQPVFKFY